MIASHLRALLFIRKETGQRLLLVVPFLAMNIPVRPTQAQTIRTSWKLVLPLLYAKRLIGWRHKCQSEVSSSDRQVVPRNDWLWDCSNSVVLQVSYASTDSLNRLVTKLAIPPIYRSLNSATTLIMGVNCIGIMMKINKCATPLLANAVVMNLYYSWNLKRAMEQVNNFCP